MRPRAGKTLIRSHEKVQEKTAVPGLIQIGK